MAPSVPPSLKKVLFLMPILFALAPRPSAERRTDLA